MTGIPPQIAAQIDDAIPTREALQARGLAAELVLLRDEQDLRTLPLDAVVPVANALDTIIRVRGALAGQGVRLRSAYVTVTGVDS